jgi:hypothetical protein
MYKKYQQTQYEIVACAYKWVWYKKMHDIFIGTTKVGGAFGTYNDGNQVAPKSASILNHVDIDEDVTQEIPKSLQNFNGSIPKVSKHPNIPLIATCKKEKVDGKPKYIYERSSGNGFLELALAFS